MGRTPECSVFGASHQTATGIPMGNWTDITPRIAIVGAGRLGTALAAALRDAGLPVDGPHGRGFDGAGADAVLLCVPDAQIAAAAACVTPGILVGHCSGATGLGVLDGHEGFGLHPLMTVPAAGADFAGAGCAIAGTSDRARSLARHLAERLGMTPFTVADEDRAAYHAAASIASNLLVALEADAERLAASAGVPREALGPARPRERRELGPRRRPTRADRADRPRRRGDRRDPARRGRRRAHPSCSRSSTSWVTAPAPSRAATRRPRG